MWYQREVLFYIKPSELLRIFHQIVQAVYSHVMRSKVLLVLLHGDMPRV